MRFLFTFPSLITFVSVILVSCGKPKGAATSISYGSNSGKYLTVQKTRIYYEEYGNGTPLLLLHQGLGSIENLSGVIPELSRHFRVIAPDAPGHGRSEQADSLSGALLADYCSNIIDQLQLDSAYVMGWSMGGNTALLLAANRPDKIKKVISGASNTKSSGLTQEGLDLLKEYTIDAVVEDKTWLKHYQRVNPQPNKWVKFWKDTQKMWSREVKVPDDKLSSINVPVLIIRGDRDMIKLEHSVDLFRALKKGQLCIYPNMGHDMPESKSEMLCKIAVDFSMRPAAKTLPITNRVPQSTLGSFPFRFPNQEKAIDTGWHIDASFPRADTANYLDWRINIHSKYLLTLYTKKPSKNLLVINYKKITA